MSSIQKQIKERFSQAGEGTIMWSGEFFSLACRDTVDAALSRLQRAGYLRRLFRGIYELPRCSLGDGGPIIPDPLVLAKALGRRGGWTIGEMINHLSKDGKYCFRTTGPTRRFDVGAYSIELINRREKTPRPLCDKEAYFNRTYRLTAEQYKMMLSVQGGVCAICGKPDRRGYHLSVDHCHLTGRIRGLLCSRCNTGLGMFRDSTEYLEKAVGYLTSDPMLSAT